MTACQQKPPPARTCRLPLVAEHYNSQHRRRTGVEQLVIENVRCFRERQAVPLRPLTILVGENSTGKSTLLALTRAAHELAHNPSVPDFNREPFLLGAWEQLAHYHGGQGKRAAKFTIGYTRQLRPSFEGEEPTPTTATVVGAFAERSAQPALMQWTLEAGTYGISLSIHHDDDEVPNVTLRAPSGMFTMALESPFRTRGFMSVFELLSGLSGPKREKMPLSASDRRALFSIVEKTGYYETEYRAVAPIRSKPHRTYDPVRDLPGPEGAHVPMLLAEYAWNNEQWGPLREKLQRFGAASGLFGKIEVKRKGNKASDPFQIHVGSGKFTFNIMDVGYGVSQVLPILVDALIGSPRSRFLLQQPEVHLHPKAAAELGTFLCALVKEKQHRFLVETHSDYLIDRVRMEVRDGHLDPDSVVILFCERAGTRVVVHHMFVDATGEFISPPQNYRAFFLNEQRRFLGA